jgi:hypothetical protein
MSTVTNGDFKPAMIKLISPEQKSNWDKVVLNTLHEKRTWLPIPIVYDSNFAWS